MKLSPGFERLNAELAHRVLRPITEALPNTRAEDLTPTVVELREAYLGRVQRAEGVAHERLEEELAKSDERPVVKIELKLRGQEIENVDQLRALLREIEERVVAQLENGVRVRLGG